MPYATSSAETSIAVVGEGPQPIPLWVFVVVGVGVVATIGGLYYLSTKPKYEEKP